MTTGLVVGLNMEQATAAVSAEAERRRAELDTDLHVWTETGRKSVLVGIARRGRPAATMLIPKDEYDGLKLLEMLEAEGHG